jgi:excisionase family DNA binding protein
MSLQKRFKKPAAPIRIADSGPRLLNLKDSATYLGSRLWAVRQLVRERKLPHIIISRGYLIDRADLDRYIEKNKIGVAA